jgi:hypothetical protein
MCLVNPGVYYFDATGLLRVSTTKRQYSSG